MRVASVGIKAPPLSPTQRDWITLRDNIGLELDLFLSGDPPPEMRRIVREIEDTLALGDHAVGLLT